MHKKKKMLVNICVVEDNELGTIERSSVLSYSTIDQNIKIDGILFPGEFKLFARIVNAVQEFNK